jgi:diaminohydroxyphosphoribosylaminopyrimidine deaminase/5-amino-6-(5-phosphoribosylamino)uracil reductase
VPPPDPVDELIGRSRWPAVNTAGRPFVVWKLAATLDGRIAAADGTSRWITSEESRAEVHLLRAAGDATMVGSGTQQADDPSLAARGVEGVRQPMRVVVDSRARTPVGARVLDGAAPALIAVAPDADAAHLEGRATVVRVPRAGGGLDPGAVLGALFERGARGVLLEGGPTLAGSFVAAGLVDRVIAYLAPALLGAGPPALADAGVATIADVVRLDVEDVDRIGPDVRVVAVPR